MTFKCKGQRILSTCKISRDTDSTALPKESAREQASYNQNDSRGGISCKGWQWAINMPLPRKVRLNDSKGESIVCDGYMFWQYKYSTLFLKWSDWCLYKIYRVGKFRETESTLEITRDWE